MPWAIAMQVKDLTVNELKALIRETIVESLAEILPDIDEGKTVKEEFKQNLLSIQKSRETESKSISAQEVARRLGLAD